MNAMPQTQDTTPHPVTVYRHGADLSLCYPLMWNVTLEYTDFNVLGKTQPGNPSPTFHTHQRTLNSMILVNRTLLWNQIWKLWTCLPDVCFLNIERTVCLRFSVCCFFFSSNLEKDGWVSVDGDCTGLKKSSVTNISIRFRRPFQYYWLHDLSIYNSDSNVCLLMIFVLKSTCKSVQIN